MSFEDYLVVGNNLDKRTSTGAIGKETMLVDREFVSTFYLNAVADDSLEVYSSIQLKHANLESDRILYLPQFRYPMPFVTNPRIV